jgi:hypothetical protein
VANEKKINHFEKELHHQMEVGKQAHDEVYSAKVTHVNIYFMFILIIVYSLTINRAIK